ncbi:MAG: hypothetical protein CMO81_00550 [Waddliaceae bacterium]|nr:hypothetical protein [Waddliaceae bacterium]
MYTVPNQIPAYPGSQASPYPYAVPPYQPYQANYVPFVPQVTPQAVVYPQNHLDGLAVTPSQLYQTNPQPIKPDIQKLQEAGLSEAEIQVQVQKYVDAQVRFLELQLNQLKDRVEKVDKYNQFLEGLIKDLSK